MENMKIYEMAKAVPSEAKKTIQAGRLKGMTDVNPMWRIKRLTELFGPCGVGWWYEITDKHIVTDEITKQSAAFMDILLYYVDPDTGATSHGIPGTGGASFVAQERNGPYLSDECYKMALTDAISVAAKALGIAADVYFDKDRSKYSGEEAAPAANKPALKPDEGKSDTPAMICADCGETVRSYLDGNGKLVSHTRLTNATIESFGRPLCKDCAAKAAASV